MATKITIESARNDTGTARTPGAWANQVRAFLCEDADVRATEAVVADTTETSEHRILETEPTYADLFNYYTKLDRPKKSRNSP